MLSKRSKLWCTLVLMMGVSATLSYGQDYDLKKDVIIKDKLPYANFSGKMGLLKPANVMISSLTGDSLIAIKAWSYPSGNPVFDFLNGYEIRFVGSGKVAIKPCGVTLANKGQFLNFILNGRDYSGKWNDTFTQSLIVNNSIDPAAEAAFIEKFDNTPAAQWAKEYEEKEKEILKNMFPLKKQKVSITFETQETQQTAAGYIETIKVYQGVLLATITKKNHGGNIPKYSYTFTRKLDQKISVSGRDVEEVYIATATADSFPKIFINADGKLLSIEIKNIASAEREITEFLINSGKL